MQVRPNGPASDELGGENRPDWRLTVGRQFNMTLIAKLAVDDSVIDSTDGVIGAFVGDELRGVGRLQYVGGLGEAYAFLLVHSDLLGSETVSFRYYDPITDAVLDIAETVTFEVDASVGSLDEPFTLRASTDVPLDGVPLSFRLSPVSPNPARAGLVRFQWALPRAELVTLRLYDVHGREVATIVDETMPAGRYERHLDASRLATGMYFYRMQAGDFRRMQKLMLLK